MRLRLTFIVVQSIKNLHFSDPKYFQIFFTDDNKFPSAYMSTKDEYETLKDLSDKYFHTDFDWMDKSICGFRKTGPQECEVTYMTKVPEILGSNKSGCFIPDCDFKTYNIEIDPYYDELLSRRSRGF